MVIVIMDGYSWEVPNRMVMRVGIATENRIMIN